MDTNRQFSLAYLFLETLWVAIVLGSARQTWVISEGMGAMVGLEGDRMKAVQCFLLMMLTAICGGAAMGGIFGRMLRGAVIGTGIGLFFLLVPCSLYIFSHP